MKWLTAVSTWLTKYIGSWGTEILGGLTLASAAQLVRLVPHVLLTAPQERYAAVVIAVTISFKYELVWDPNGFSWADVGQRSVGLVLGLGLWFWIT